MSTMTTTVAVTTKRSFAEIVKGQSADMQNSQQNLKPAARGSLLCHCRGEVLSMLTHYGWIMAYGTIDHSSVKKHEGHVYISTQDVVDSKALVPGDIVTFYLHVDDKGLGAEECRLEKYDALYSNPNAAEFLPMTTNAEGESNFNPNAPEFLPMLSNADCESCGQGMRADAKEFVPRPAWYDQSVLGTVGSENEARDRLRALNSMFLTMSQFFADSDDEDEDGDSSEDGDCCGLPSKVKRAASSDGSTSAGSTSDSEGDASFHALPKNFRPPPGLSLPSPSELKAMAAA